MRDSTRMDSLQPGHPMCQSCFQGTANSPPPAASAYIPLSWKPVLLLLCLAPVPLIPQCRANTSSHEPLERTVRNAPKVGRCPRSPPLLAFLSQVRTPIGGLCVGTFSSALGLPNGCRFEAPCADTGYEYPRYSTRVVVPPSDERSGLSQYRATPWFPPKNPPFQACHWLLVSTHSLLLERAVALVSNPTTRACSEQGDVLQPLYHSPRAPPLKVGPVYYPNTPPKSVMFITLQTFGTGPQVPAPNLAIGNGIPP